VQPRRFHGGLRLPMHKAESTARGIARCSLPPRLYVSLAQHAGEPARACVVPGQRVRRGARIGEAQGERSAHVHAPASGLVVGVRRRAGGEPARAWVETREQGFPPAFSRTPPSFPRTWEPTDFEASGESLDSRIRGNDERHGHDVGRGDDEDRDFDQGRGHDGKHDGGKSRGHDEGRDFDGNGQDADTIVIEVDADDDCEVGLPPFDWQTCAPADLIARIADAGIVGLGGAAFPSAEKLAHPRRLLILNGAECEPWIACDDALLRERARDVLQGGRVLRRAVGAQRVLLAIEDRMDQALAAARAALDGSDDIELAIVPTIYPEGGERQLIEALTGEQVPAGGLPRDLGVIVHNVGTAAAVWQAVAMGQALVSRIVSVTGPGVARPGNYEVAFGTPIAHLIEQAGGYTSQAARLVIGGPMMGVALPDDGAGIDKRSNCVLVLGQGEVRRGAPTLPCIRCGDCARACPASLLPQQLHFFLRSGDQTRALQHGLTACIECGCCDLVCPSRLPLAEQFRLGKQAVRERAHAAALADASRARFEARNARLAREAQERTLREAQHKPSASSAVQAALERAKARKRGEE
jgi:electron transport complex protein RnfC